MDIVALGPFATTSLSWQRGREWVITVVCKATFDLVPGELRRSQRQEPIHDGDVYRERDGRRVAYAPNDRVPYKARADVVLVGVAHPSRQKRARSVAARLVVGPLDKAIEVAAEREWVIETPIHQQLVDLEADQEVVLEHLHPDHARLATRLPGLHTYAFVERSHAPAQELAMTLDTLWIDAERSICTLTWRGQLSASRSDEPGRVLVAIAGARQKLTLDDARGLAEVLGDRAGGSARARSTPTLAEVPRLSDEDTDDDESQATVARKDPAIDVVRQAVRAQRAAAQAAAAAEAQPPPAPAPSATPAPPAPTPAAMPSPPTPAVPPLPPAPRPLPLPPRRPTSTEERAPLPTPPARRPTLSEAQQPPAPAPAPLPPRRPTLSEAQQPPVQPRATSSTSEHEVTQTGLLMDELNEESTHTSLHNLGEGGDRTDASPGWLAQPRAAGAPSATSTIVGLPFERHGAPPGPQIPPAPPPVPAHMFNTTMELPAPNLTSAREAPVVPVYLPADIAAPAAPAPVAPAPVAPAPVAPPIPAAQPVRETSPWAAGASSAVGTAAFVNLTSTHVVEEPPPPAPEPAPKPREAARASKRATNDVVELLWFDPSAVARVRSRYPSIIDQLEFEPLDPKHDLPLDDPQASRDRHHTFGVLTRASPIDGRGIVRAMLDAVGESGRFTPPIVLVTGELRFPFDEVEVLKATVAAVTPLAGAGDDLKLKATLEAAGEVLKAPLLQTPSQVETSTQQLRDALNPQKRGLPSGYLDAHVERVMLAERRYQKRTIFGDEHVRALLVPSGESSAIPAYLPATLSTRLPLVTKLKVKVLAEAHSQQDQYESHPHALKVIALGRVLSFEGYRA
jgi:hypothetical protein